MACVSRLSVSYDYGIIYLASYMEMSNWTNKEQTK